LPSSLEPDEVTGRSPKLRMSFLAPEGTDLVEVIGTGSVFHVAVVKQGTAMLVCKRLLPRVRDEREARAAIVREAKALTFVKHPSVPVLVRVGTDRDGPFVLETRMTGVSMRALGRAWHTRGGPPRTLVHHIASSAARALAELHAIRIDDEPLELVHGDISPDHLLLGPIGDVRFVDFGAARFRGMEPELQTSDRGTLPYVAPEVARGDVAPSSTADVYALAATLLAFATNQPLCAAKDEPAMLLEIGQSGVRLSLIEQSPSLSPVLQSALRAALDPDPSRRPARAQDLLEAFEPGAVVA